MVENQLPIFNKNNACAVTGHRILPKNFDRDELKCALSEIYKKGFNLFLVGMAIGFDTECFKALELLKKEFSDLKIAAIIPCLDQSAHFNSNEKKEYDKMVDSSDYKVILAEKYDSGCMLRRNDFLVDNSSLIFAYLTVNKGGTYYTVNRAQKKGVKVEYFQFKD